jgi:catechol 2,3-dioxygenase-like lactoylglutathione lyase family enzyme
VPRRSNGCGGFEFLGKSRGGNDDGSFGSGAVVVITGLDHVVVLVRDIAAGATAFEKVLARAPAWRSSGDGADRVLFTLDNMTLELVAPNGDGAAGDRIREVIPEQGEGLASICFRTGDIAKMHRRLDRLALKPEPVTQAESRDTISGAMLSWQRTRAATSATRGVRLFFLELAKERLHSAPSAAAEVTALDHLVISTGDPERAAALYGARLGLDMALDRSHPDWGQLMFFRCGDLIVEIVHRPNDQATDATRDRIWGLSWRVADIDGTRARLLSAGVDVSDVRAGRKPGTRVVTVRSSTCGIPTLLVECSAQPAS